MRLWHEALIPYLSTKRLVRQHCECCALRGNGWGRNHATVNYVFKHSPERLFKYHLVVMAEMEERGYKYDTQWLNPLYRGKHSENWSIAPFYALYGEIDNGHKYVYPEHDDDYLQFCLQHLDKKGEHIDYAK